MLQVAEKSKRVKRKALLMETKEAEPEESGERASDLPYEPQPLTGEAFDRMRMDPEIRRMRKRFLVGSVTVLGMVAIAATLHFTGVLNRLTAKADFEEKYGEVETTPELDREEAFGFPGGRPKLEEPPSPPPISGKLVFSGLERADTGSAATSGSGSTPFADQRMVLESFLNATGIEQKLQWVANRAAVAPAMREYYSRKNRTFGSNPRLGKSVSAGPKQTEHEVVFSSGEIRLATVLETANGFRVDWPSFVAYGEMSWADFLAAKPNKPVLMRVKAAPGGRFENQFGDPSWFRCVNLTHVDDASGQLLFGYVERSSDLGREIEHWLDLSDGQPIPLTVRLKYPVDIFSDRQVWITDLVKAGWVTSKPLPTVGQR